MNRENSMDEMSKIRLDRRDEVPPQSTPAHVVVVEGNMLKHEVTMLL